MSLQPIPASLRASVASPLGVADALPGHASQAASTALADAGRALLKDKNLGLLCDDPSLDDALLAYRAAVDLGARVALVRPRFTGAQEVRAIPETARMLGRLYEIIVCVALPADLVEALRRESGVPVLGDIDVEARAGSACEPSPASDDPRDFHSAQRLRQWHKALAASLA